MYSSHRVVKVTGWYLLSTDPVGNQTSEVLSVACGYFLFSFLDEDTLALLDKKSDRAVQRLHTREPKFGPTETLHEILHEPNMRMCVLESSGPSALSTLKTVRSSYTASTEQH